MEGKAVPEGYHSVNVYLCVDGAARALDFYKAAFGATETMRIDQPDGRIGHAEIRIGDSTVMLSDEFPEMGATGPKSLGGSPVMLHVYVADADATVAAAVAAGATLVRPVADQFYGDRGGLVVDPFGHKWWVATRKEELSAEEIVERAKANRGTGSGSPGS
ncbi:MAG: VOC family protein [Limnobacter sp.]|nr:VOC family protein [Limnobacter sp.]